MGYAVILQDDALFHVLEEPSDGPAYAETAALVGVGIEPLDVTGPVDCTLDYRPSGGYLFGFTWMICIGAVAGYEQAGWRDWANGVDHLLQGMRAAPDDQK